MQSKRGPARPANLQGGQSPRGVKLALFWVIVFMLILAVIEGGAALATSYLTHRGLMAHIPEISERDISLYLYRRNPLLGWGPRVADDGRAVHLTPRPAPLPASGMLPCISVYGDSFVYGYSVADDATFPHFLSKVADCPVSNHGVDGYGSDQAFMLFRAQQHLDAAPIVILSHLSENILRNVNRYRNLLYSGSPIGFKPRLVVRGERLDYVPIPVNSRHDFRALEENPDSVLSGDALLVRPRRTFPYSVALARWLTQDFKVRARVLGVPTEATFYTLGHSAGGLELTSRILSTFVREAAEQGRRGVVLLIPTAQALNYAAKTGLWTDQPLADALSRTDVPVIHAGPKILERLAGADPCSLFDGCKQQHFNSAGNQLLADVVADQLDRLGMLPGASGRIISQRSEQQDQH